jgi:transcriptional regulator with XRE-family HTH domain
MRAAGAHLRFDEGQQAAAGMRNLRRQQEISQERLAVMLGVSQSWVSAYERGAGRLRRGDAEKVAAALGTDYTGLLAAGARQQERTGQQ